jgi:enediyne biosynthesis protein E4
MDLRHRPITFNRHRRLQRRALPWVALVVAVAGARIERTATAADPQGLFVDAAQAVGLDFQHRSGRTGAYYFPEISGSGAALFDFDNDGDLDAYLVQSGRLQPPGDATGRSAEPRTGANADRLYRNDLAGGTGLRFTDVTGASRIATRGYGQGVAAGDYDGDGWVDLYVTSFGPNQLLRNLGDGTFRDVTAQARADDPRWSTSAAFVDYDRDGWLDLFIASYVDFAFPIHKPCLSPQGRLDYCGPRSYAPLPHRLLRNRGDGTFDDVSARAGILTARGNGLGVATADLDGDGWIDIFVANDQMENFLWLNRRDGTFREVALDRGAALSFNGLPEAGMGVDAGDFDADGDEDLFITHLRGQKNTLYVNDGRGSFDDQSVQSGLGSLSQPFTGFGAAWLDWDNDGRLDLLAVNGAVLAVEALRQAGDPFPYSEPIQLFRNLGGGKLRDVSAEAGPAFARTGVGRGAAFGDVDNDGDVDVLVAQIDGRARLLLNQVGARNHWLGVRAVAGKRDALGARVVLRRPRSPALWRRVRTDASYLSASDPRIVFGLGADAAGGTVDVHWPDGTKERFPAPSVDRYMTLVQGRGQRLP